MRVKKIGQWRPNGARVPGRKWPLRHRFDVFGSDAPFYSSTRRVSFSRQYLKIQQYDFNLDIGLYLNMPEKIGELSVYFI